MSSFAVVCCCATDKSVSFVSEKKSGKFEDEISKELKHTGAGVLSMVSMRVVWCLTKRLNWSCDVCFVVCFLQANAGPNTNGSQFFVTLAPTPWLDGANSFNTLGDSKSGLVLTENGRVVVVAGKHTVFGRISAGMKVIQRMGLVPTGANDRYIIVLPLLQHCLFEH